MMPSHARGILLVASLAGCRHATPSPTPVAEFLLGPCPGRTIATDTTQDIVLQPKVRIPFFHSRHTDGEGRVAARVTVDSLGRAEPGSIIIVYSDDARLSRGFCMDLLEQSYEPARVAGRPRRTRGTVSVGFLGRGNAPASPE